MKSHDSSDYRPRTIFFTEGNAFWGLLPAKTASSIAESSTSNRSNGVWFAR